jgi:sec-independent protein translocase protein TatB
MNIFSNLGITELVIILLLALIVVGPERLPELARQLGKTLRDLRKAYDNLTREIGPELASIQEATREIKESVDSVRTIPQDAVKSALKAADLDDTVAELKDVSDSIGQVGKTLSETKKVMRDPLGSAVGAARKTLDPKAKEAETAGKPKEAAGDEALPPLPPPDTPPPAAALGAALSSPEETTQGQQEQANPEPPKEIEVEDEKEDDAVEGQEPETAK